MAAVYTTGSDAASATAAADLRTKLDTAILTHTNWSSVENISITGGTSNVYKCSGTNNSYGTDFYMAMTILTATPLVLRFQLFESYVAGSTHQATRSIRTSSTASTAPSTGNGYVVDNTGYTLDNAAVPSFALTLDGTNIWVWGLHVSKSRIELSVAQSGGASMAGFIGGVYTLNSRAVAGVNNVFPLFAASGTSAIVTAAGASSATVVNFSRNYASGGTMQVGQLVGSSPNYAGVINTAGAILDPVEGVLRGTGVVVQGTAAPTNLAGAAPGFQRGSLPGAYAFGSTSTYPRPLDLIQLSDATQLMTIGIGGASTMQLFVDTASDN
jgi:hypothetical protein